MDLAKDLVGVSLKHTRAGQTVIYVLYSGTNQDRGPAYFPISLIKGPPVLRFGRTAA